MTPTAQRDPKKPFLGKKGGGNELPAAVPSAKQCGELRASPSTKQCLELRAAPWVKQWRNLRAVWTRELPAKSVQLTGEGTEVPVSQPTTEEIENVSTCTLPSDYELENTPDNFIAGKTALYLDQWKNITGDKWILQTVCGYRMQLPSCPSQVHVPKPIQFDSSEQYLIDQEISRFLKCKIIEPVNGRDPDEFISNIFIRPKKDGRIRIILNLKQFNMLCRTCAF